MLPCAVSVDCCWKCYLVLCLLAVVGSVTLCCVCWLLLEVLPCAVSVGCFWKCYLVLCRMTMLIHSVDCCWKCYLVLCLLTVVAIITVCCNCFVVTVCCNCFMVHCNCLLTVAGRGASWSACCVGKQLSSFLQTSRLSGNLFTTVILSTDLTTSW